MKKGRGHTGPAARPAHKSSEREMHQALTFHQSGKLAEAKALYETVLARDPEHFDALHLLGLIAHQTNDLARADELMCKAIAVKSDNPVVHSNRGWVLHCLGRFDEALASCDRAIALKPDYAEAWSNRGITLQALKRLDEAVASYDRAIALKPDYGEAWSNRGITLHDLKRFDEALTSYDRAIALKRGFVDAFYNRGNTLQEMRRFEEALASFTRAIALKPDHASALYNRGNTLQDLKRLDEAIASYDRAISIKQNYAEAHFYKSHALLLAGAFEKGWALHEWRWKMDSFPSPKRNFREPLWLGAEPLEGKTILLHAEQGLGDTIQFCRYAKFVSALGARVLLEVPQPLMGLFARFEGVDSLIQTGKALPAFQYHCPLLSLPLAFKTDLSNIPSPTPYLTSDPDKRSAWAARLGPTTKPRVGIVWSGNAGHKNDHNRSVRLQEFLDHLPGGCDYVSLQKELREGDKEVLAASTVRHHENEQSDFTDTAALCDLMDIVVTVDTSVAHLAGALGRPAWLLLPFVPDWRWLLDRDDTPWYQSVKLYRQTEDRNWRPVLRRVADDLSKLTPSARPLSQ